MHVGTILIYLSLAASVVLFGITVLYLIKKKDYGKFIENLFFVSGLFITLALCLLFAAFLKGRYDLKYVYDYSSNSLPVYYKLAAVWAGQGRNISAMDILSLYIRSLDFKNKGRI